MSRPGSGARFLEFLCTEPHADDAMEEEKMELMHRRCCGLDVHKETVVACLRLVSDGQVTTAVRTFYACRSGWRKTIARMWRWKRPASTGSRCGISWMMASLRCCWQTPRM